MNPNMMKQLQKMQKDMMKTQAELEQSVFKGTAGGIVSVEVNGKKEVLTISVTEDPEDLDMLVDLIKLATNQAMQLVDVTTEQKMSKFTGGMKGFGF